jgi:hypothetical protein
MEEDSAAIHVPALSPWLATMLAAAQGGRGVEAVLRRIAMLNAVRIVRIVVVDRIVLTYQRFMRL